MFALIAYKRPSLTPHRYQLAFEIRQFGCFNGFNCDGAFTTQPSSYTGTTFDVVFDDLLENGALSVDYWTGGRPFTQVHYTALEKLSSWDFSKISVPGATGVQRGEAGSADNLVMSLDAEARPWECIGIGYMCYDLGNWRGEYQYHLRDDPQRPGTVTTPVWQGTCQLTTGDMNPRITGLLNSRRINSEFYDPLTGDMVLSKREPTKNEQFLQAFLLGCEKAPLIAKYSLKSSRMFTAITHSPHLQHAVYELVGSERPSGLAISYLQTWRNVVEKEWQGDKTQRGVASKACLLKLADRWPASLDPIPLMAYLCNNGDDSDILAFAGKHFIMYATKFGVFNCESFYRRSDSMVIEGRYNKGQQSTCIAGNFNDKLVTKADDIKAKYQTAYDTVTQLGRYFEHCKNVPTVESLIFSMNEWMKYHRSDASPTAITQRATELSGSVCAFLRAEAEADPELLFSKIREVAKALPSFRTTRKSHLELNPNPLGFRDWVAQAEGRRPEGATAEGGLGVPATGVLAEAAPEGAGDGATLPADVPANGDPGAGVQLGGLTAQDLGMPIEGFAVRAGGEIVREVIPAITLGLGQARPTRAQRNAAFAEHYGAGPATLNRVLHGQEAAEMRETMADAQRAGTAAINRLFD